MTKIGCKFLQFDCGSLVSADRVIYPADEWISVPGDGAYVAISGGLSYAGTSPVLAFFECAAPTGAPAPAGVVCFRRVRRLQSEPVSSLIGKISSEELLGEIAFYGGIGITRSLRVAAALRSSPEWRGRVACYASDISREDRVALAKESTPEWRGQVALNAPDLSREDRVALAMESTPEWRGDVACGAAGLTREDRMALALRSTPLAMGRVACNAPDLLPDDRVRLARLSVPPWPSLVARYAPGLDASHRAALWE